MIEHGASGALTEKNWLLEMLKKFDHPSTALWRAVEARHIQALLSEMVFEAPILDLGCGNGKFSSAIFAPEKLDIGLDTSEWDIARAGQSTVYETVMVGDARCLPFQNESFNVVFSNCVLEHIRRIDEVLNEVSRVLKADGAFIFTAPSDSFGDYLFVHVFLETIGLKKFARWYSKKRNQLLNHYNCYDPMTWKHKIMNVGLNVLKARYYLSKSTVEIWDFWAICIFLLRILGVFKTRASALLLSKSRKIRISVFRRILYGYYSQNRETGGALLIVAKRTKNK